MGASARAILAASANAGVGLSGMDRAMGMLSQRSGPALGRTFGMLSSQAISMTTGFSGASGVLSMLGQSMLMVSPVIGGVAIAAAAMTTVFIKKKDVVKQTTEALTLNADALLRLASANDSASATFEKVRQAQLAEAIAVVATLEKDIAVWGEYFKERDQLLIESGKTLEREHREQLQLLQSYADKLDAARARVESLRLPALELGPPTPTGYEMDQERAAAEALRIRTNEQALLNIALEQQNRLKGDAVQLELEYTTILATSLEVQGNAYMAMQNMAVGTEAVKRKAVEQTTKAILTANQMRVVSYAQGAAQMLVLEKKNIGEVLQAVIAGVEAELAAKAILWAAEGIALLFSNPAEAATKFAAAAAAGVGVGALAVIGSTFEQEQGGAGGAAIAGSAGGEGASTGRTLVSQGPVTLYYNATLVVNGSILDRGDFFSLWNEANLQNLRTAGVDAGKRAKG